MNNTIQLNKIILIIKSKSRVNFLDQLINIQVKIKILKYFNKIMLQNKVLQFYKIIWIFRNWYQNKVNIQFKNHQILNKISKQI